MKFLKKLLITLLVIVLLVGGVIAAAYVLLYDNQTKGFKNIEGGFDITNHVADSIYDSLENIKVTNYTENHLDLELTEDNINAFIIKMVQTKVPEYPETKSSIVEMNGAALDCVYVRGVGETFELYVCVRYKSIMYSSLKISANFKIEDNKLSFKVDTVKLGKYINISPEKAASMLGGFLPTTGEGGSPVEGLDLNTMTFSLDLNKIIQDNVQEPFVRDLLRALKYEAGIHDGVIKLKIDTKDIFIGPRTPVHGDPSGIADLSTIISSMDPFHPSDITLELNESQFNALAEDDLKNGLAQFRPSFDFGTKHF
ncbi:MAG: hypothetical protein MJ238_03085, partial [Bacilli bacterium]|nr:hypothetical protein [Bacilli bacterium]